jgi:uncharacterized repeat protein (TIGR03803 family)
VTADGEQSWAGLVLATDGNFYGTTFLGGSKGFGAIFQVTSAGEVTILHSFSDGSVTNDGKNPRAALLQGADGNLYGTTEYGGSAGDGVIFEITLKGVLTILHSFGDGSVTSDGEFPTSSLVQTASGDIYGTTSLGGTAGSGTAFQLVLPGTVAILHNFAGGKVPVTNDGTFPIAGLTLATNGDFYGTTNTGGSINAGTIYKMTPAGAITILHSFGDNTVADDGLQPIAVLIQATDGNLYGTTIAGGSQNSGTVFYTTMDGNVAVIHSFADGTVTDDGMNPESPLFEGTDGNFYGTTFAGGVGGLGTLYRVTPLGGVTILHTFGDVSVADDGTNPIGGVITGSNGALYGATRYGGAAGQGIVFESTGDAAAPTPVISPNGGTFAGGTTVTLTDTLSGAVIYYTTDGTIPTRLSSVYNSPISVTSSETITAMAVLAGYTNSATASTVFTITPNAVGTFSSGLQLFSLPYTYTDFSLDSIFGYTGVKVAAWDAANNDYDVTPTAPSDSIVAGQGYWVRFPTTVTLQFAGTLTQTFPKFVINLKQGWNMIGDPFTGGVELQNLEFNNGTESYLQATNYQNPLVGVPFYSYNTATGSYVAATAFLPYTGYWVYAYSATNMEVIAP